MDKIKDVICNVRDMLVLRGENIDSFIEKEKTMNPSTFYRIETIQKEDKTKHITLCSDKTCVIFALNGDRKKLLISDIKIKVDKKKKEDDKEEDETLIISNSNIDLDIPEKYKIFVATNDYYMNYIFVFNMITPSDKQILSLFDKSLQSAGGLLTVFTEFELYFNPTSHELVDAHRKIDQKEIETLMSTNNLKSKNNLPLILKSDPIAKWLGLKVGDIVEIDRYNPTSGLYKYYRVCN